MCTVSWHLRAEGYVLLANRDERLTRSPAAPPELRVQGGIPYIAPTDGDAGGTWICANAAGVALTLLNDDPVGGERDDFVSRGHLVRSLAHRTGADDVAQGLAADALERYRGFRLVVLGPGAAPELFAWDRERLVRRALEPASLPLVSSSFGDRDEVAAQRGRAWEHFVTRAGGPRSDRLLAFHRSRHPGPGPGAVCMQREDAATVSGSWIEVGPDDVRFRYCAAAPSDDEFGDAVVLGRV